MKLLRYGDKGAERPGLLDAAGRIRALSGEIGDLGGAALAPDRLRQLAALAPESLPLVESEPRLGPCVGNVGKFICIGLNYADHAAEAGMPIPDEPVVFLKATSSISGPNDPVLMPVGGSKLDWEAELAVVIGSAGRNIPEAEALEHVAGYCVVNDVSERAFQLERNGQWAKGKSADSFGPIGPWLVTRDEVPDSQALDIWLEVDGTRRQNGNTRTMIFPVPYLVSYVSQFMSLQPGDVIATGTPPGVGLGQKPQPIFLEAGQVVRLGVHGLGEQRQEIRAA
ncbi:MAG: fumarylacetoacetate hydrolase family protein [Kiloniellales bacterium]